MSVDIDTLNRLMFHNRGGWRKPRQTPTAKIFFELLKENDNLKNEIKRLEGTIQYLVTKGVQTIC